MLLLCACSTPAQTAAGTPDPTPTPADPAPPQEHPTSSSSAKIRFDAHDLRLGDVPKLSGGTLPADTRVDPEIADLPFHLQTVPVTAAELQWVFEVSFAARGLELSGGALRRQSEPRGNLQTFVARTRDPDASRSARFAERTWRGQVTIASRDDLLVITGPSEAARSVRRRLSELDHIAEDPLAR